MSNSNNVVAAHIKVFINGTLYGQAVGITWSIPTPHVERRGIDSMTAFELSPTTYKVSGSIQVLRTHDDGGLEGRGIVAPVRHIPREKYFSLLLVSRVTGSRLFQCDHCKVTGQTWSAMAKGRMEGSFTFDAIVGENEAQYP